MLREQRQEWRRKDRYRRCAGNFNFISLPGTHLFGVLLDLALALRAQRGLIPVLIGHFVLNFDDRRVDSAFVHLGIHQVQRDLGHAGGLALARAGKNHVRHVRAAQALGALLSKHPADGVGDVRLAAAVRADNGRDAVTVELQFGAVAKGLEAQNLKLFQFQQRCTPCARTLNAAGSVLALAADRKCARCSANNRRSTRLPRSGELRLGAALLRLPSEPGSGLIATSFLDISGRRSERCASGGW